MMGAWSRFNSNASVGPITVGHKYKQLLHGQVTRDNFDIISRATWCKNVPVVPFASVACTTAGDKELPGWAPIEIDNTDGILSSFVDAIEDAVLVVRFRFRLRVSDSALQVTPKLFYGTDLEDLTAITTVATIDGEAACSADDLDFSGANQYQMVEATLPGGGVPSVWKPAITAGGTPAAGLFAEVSVWHDVFVRFS